MQMKSQVTLLALSIRCWLYQDQHQVHTLQLCAITIYHDVALMAATMCQAGPVSERASVSLSLYSTIFKIYTAVCYCSSAHTSACKALQTPSTDAVHVQAARANMSRSHNYNCICRSTAVLHTPDRQRQVTCPQRNRCRGSERTHLYIYGTARYHITTRLTRQQKPHC
jgi:hypothetical protein